VLSKCANPACHAAFRFLHEGKLFAMDVELDPDSSPGAKHLRRVEFFWLCDSCCAEMTLRLDKTTGIVTTERLVRSSKVA